MSMLLEGTNASAVNAAISAERHRLGATSTGMVLTFVIVTDELSQSEATRAATFAANQHPCRIIVVIPRPGRGKPQLDAEVWVGDREGPGETVKLRLKGPLARQQASVVLPLLLPDTPVVVWWPADAPVLPAQDEVGRMANRRITDAASARRPLADLASRAQSYHPGDTDLAWTRTTPWRSVLATALDEPHQAITGVTVSSERNNASATLLAAWLQARLKVPAVVKNSRGPGITSVVLRTKNGEIGLNRPDAHLAELTRTHGISRRTPLPRRELRDLVSEELRRLDADEIYAEALAELAKGLGGPTRPSRSRKPALTSSKVAAVPTAKPKSATGAPTAAKSAVAKSGSAAKAAPAAKSATATKPTAKRTTKSEPKTPAKKAAKKSQRKAKQ